MFFKARKLYKETSIILAQAPVAKRLKQSPAERSFEGSSKFPQKPKRETELRLSLRALIFFQNH